MSAAHFFLEHTTNSLLHLEYVWSQEEHRNAGAWAFVAPRMANLVGVTNLVYAGRPVLGQPAVGVAQVHQREAAHVMQETFKKLK